MPCYIRSCRFARHDGIARGCVKGSADLLESGTINVFIVEQASALRPSRNFCGQELREDGDAPRKARSPWWDAKKTVFLFESLKSGLAE